MAASNLNLGKASGGVLNIQPADGTTNTSLVLPASGTVVATDVAVTDNAIARYDGTTGKVQNSGVIIDDNNNITTNGSISSTFADSRVILNSSPGAIGCLNSTLATWKPLGFLYGNGPFTIKDASVDLERMRIDSFGNVGIGGTPSAWGGINKVVQVGLGSSFNGRSDSYATEVTTNSYRDSSNTYRYLGNATAAEYAQSNGIHYWFTAPSGTAGNAITWTNAMTLDANGSLLVGTTTNNGVDKLQINGTISYKTPSGRIVGTILANAYITDTNSHTLTIGGANSPLMLEIVNGNSGVTCIPIYPYGGTGIKFIWNVLNPATGAFVNNVSTQNISLTVTDKGYYPNTYIITLFGGNSNITIQATTLNAYFTAYLTVM